MVGTMRERVPVDNQQWSTGKRWRVPSRRAARGLRSGPWRIAPRLRIAQHDPRRGVIAGAWSRANFTIDARADKALRRLGAQQQMIDAKPSVPRTSVSRVVPERVHRRVRAQRPDRVNPTLVQNAPKKRAAFRLKQSVFSIGFGWIDIAVRRHDVVVAREHDRDACAIELLGMPREALHPSKLVREFGAGLWVAVRGIERRDQYPVHGRLDIAALRVNRFARQLRARDNGLAIAGENSDAIPRLLAAPNRAVARFRKRGLRKLRICSLELLKRDDVGLSGAQPVEQVDEALVDIVNVEGRDFHPARTVIAEVRVTRAAWRS